MDIVRYNKICGALWCNQLSARANGSLPQHIGTTEFCEKCALYIRDCANQEGLSPEIALTKVLPIPTHAYQWDIGRDQIKPSLTCTRRKGYVTCGLPWCNRIIRTNKETIVYPDVYACTCCRRYIQLLIQKRPKYRGKTWREIALYAVLINCIPAPRAPEPCGLPWCQAVRPAYRRGSNGESICNTDSNYLFKYAKNHGLSFDQAWQQASTPTRKYSHRKRTAV